MYEYIYLDLMAWNCSSYSNNQLLFSLVSQKCCRGFFKMLVSPLQQYLEYNDN